MSFSWQVLTGCSNLNLGEKQEDMRSLQVEGLLASRIANLPLREWGSKEVDSGRGKLVDLGGRLQVERL
jgi:hypothetical protein